MQEAYTTNEILRMVIQLERREMNRSAEMRAAAALRRLGFKSTRIRIVRDGVRLPPTRVYLVPKEVDWLTDRGYNAA